MTERAKAYRFEILFAVALVAAVLGRMLGEEWLRGFGGGIFTALFVIAVGRRRGW